MSISAKQQRAAEVNQVIRIIAAHGRRFFFSQAKQAYASMEVDARGKVWFIDDYSGKRIYVHKTGFDSRWKGFTHGGTLRGLVECFRDYICSGKQLHPSYLGPERANMSNGNIWGYEPGAMSIVREQAAALPVFLQQEQQP
jgi:hypothetical protein